MPCEALFQTHKQRVKLSHDFNECHGQDADAKVVRCHVCNIETQNAKVGRNMFTCQHRKQTLDSHDFNECHVKHCFKHTSTAKFCHDFKECHGQDVNMFFPPIRWLLAHQIHALSDAMCATSRSISGRAFRSFKKCALATHRARLAILATSAWRSRSWQSSTIQSRHISQNTPGQYRTSSSCRR